MSTIKIIKDEEVWNYIGHYLFPQGVPYDPQYGPKVTPFSGGYPDDHRNPTEHGTAYLELEWNHDFTREQEAEWRRFHRMARRKGEYWDRDMDLAEQAGEACKRWLGRDDGDEGIENIIGVLDALCTLALIDLKDDEYEPGP